MEHKKPIHVCKDCGQLMPDGDNWLCVAEGCNNNVWWHVCYQCEMDLL